MEFRILGPLEVLRDGRPLALGGPKPRAVLAILLLHANEVVSSDRLIDMLWGDEPPASAAKVLQVYISSLRKVLEPASDPDARMLLTEPSGYVLHLEREAFDLHRFEDLTASAGRSFADGDPAHAAACLADALDLWRGPPLADFSFESFAQVEITRLQEMRLSALESRIEADLALGRHADVIPELVTLQANNPGREPVARLLMLALYRTGRQADALDAYRRVRATLVEELGLEPGPQLQEMHRKVLAQDDSLRWVPPRSHPTPNNLPAAVTSFVGRVHELDVVTALMAEHRLVTLTGPGGCGKSRLAVELAVRALPANPHGVWLTELAPITDGALVADIVSATLGIREAAGRDPLATIADAVADRSVLLILDNCEHVVESCASVAQGLLQSCPNLRILATSRQALAIPGEVSYDVPSLSFPVAGEDAIGRFADYGAIRLFAERARAADPGFELDDTSGPTVGQICRRLDGMPLALELAASRVRTMSVEEIATRLDDRFRLLTGGSRMALARHQTLRGAIDWSYALLSEDERRLFARLSVFSGGFTLAAVESVCSGDDDPRDTLDLLTRLVDKSLVSVQRRDGRGRYRLLETVRAYAAEALDAAGESEQVHGHHAAFFVDLAERAAPDLKGPGQRSWLKALEAEQDNFRAALEWLGATGRHERQMRLAATLWRQWYLSGRYSEGRRWLETALLHDDAPPSVRADALLGAGALAFYQCDYPDAEPRCRHALSLYRSTDDARGAASALTLLGGIARERADYDACLRLHAEALSVYRELADEWGIAHSMQMSGFASWLRGELEAARAFSGEAFDRFEALGDEERASWALMDLGAIAHYAGDGAEARRLIERSRSSFEDLGFKEGVAWSLNLLALIDIEDGQDTRARRNLEDALSVHRDLGDRWRMCSVLETLAAVEGRAGTADVGAALLGSADKLRTEIGTPIPPCERPLHDDAVLRLRAALGDAFDQTYGSGRTMTLQQTVRLAMSAHSEGDRPQALHATDG